MLFFFFLGGGEGGKREDSEKNHLEQSPGGGTWPMFGYRGAAGGLKSWHCLGQKYS